jgi:hypothetical protein
MGSEDLRFLPNALSTAGETCCFCTITHQVSMTSQYNQDVSVQSGRFGTIRTSQYNQHLKDGLNSLQCLRITNNSEGAPGPGHGDYVCNCSALPLYYS